MDFPLAKPETLLDAHDVARLVAYLHQEDRERPVAVLTVPPGAAAPHVDATDIVRVGGGAIDVVTVPDQLTWVLSEAMGGRAYTPFLGACRVYPPGNAWRMSLTTGKLWMTSPSEEVFTSRMRIGR